MARVKGASDKCSMWSIVPSLSHPNETQSIEFTTHTQYIEWTAVSWHSGGGNSISAHFFCNVRFYELRFCLWKEQLKLFKILYGCFVCVMCVYTNNVHPSLTRTNIQTHYMLLAIWVVCGVQSIRRHTQSTNRARCLNAFDWKKIYRWTTVWK